MKFSTLFLFPILLCDFGQSYKIYTSLISKTVKPVVHRILDDTVNGTECQKDLKIFIRDLFNLELWALQMADATAKFNSGILYGNIRFFGSHDQCLSLKNGQYCTARVTVGQSIEKWAFDSITTTKNKSQKRQIFSRDYFIKNFHIHFGFCMPKSCSVENLNSIASHVVKKVALPVRLFFENDMCLYEDKPIPTTRTDVYVFSFFGFMLAIVVLSTVYDIYLRKVGKNRDIFVSFSSYTNIARLLSTHCENDSLTCLYGMRVISMMWIILSHVTMRKLISNCTNTAYVLTEMKNQIDSVLIFAAAHAVDTFLTISGILVIYSSTKHAETKRINALVFYLLRLGRLMPVVIATVLFYISAVKYVGDGPMWPFVLNTMLKNCEDFWWGPLFFVNNFLNQNNRCVGATWFLSVDTQFRLLFPVIFFFIRRNPKKAFFTILVVCLTCIFYVCHQVIEKEAGFVLFENDIYEIRFSLIAQMPLWLIGLTFGYFLSKKDIKIPTITNLVLWIVSLTTLCGLILYNSADEYSLARSVFLNAFSRSLWCLSVGFIILSCATQHGGFINSFLSHPVFIVLGKLTYCMFLTHMFVVTVVVWNKRQSDYFSKLEIFLDFCGVYVLSVICSVVSYLVFEAPFNTLLKHTQRRKFKQS